MKGGLALTLAVEPVERIEADVVVVGFFEEDRPLRGDAGRADWRLCGRISRLIAGGRLGSVPGQAALIPSTGGLRAPRVVALHLGARRDFDAARCRQAAADGLGRALKLGASTVALPVADPGTGLELDARLEALLAGVLAARDRSGEAAVEIQLLGVAEERPAAARWLGAALAEAGDPGVVLRAAPARVPAGPRAATPTGP